MCKGTRTIFKCHCTLDNLEEECDHRITSCADECYEVTERLNQWCGVCPSDRALEQEVSNATLETLDDLERRLERIKGQIDHLETAIQAKRDDMERKDKGEDEGEGEGEAGATAS